MEMVPMWPIVVWSENDVEEVACRRVAREGSKGEGFRGGWRRARAWAARFGSDSSVKLLFHVEDRSVFFDELARIERKGSAMP